MSEILIQTIAFLIAGFVVGKFYINLNPWHMIIGLILLLPAMQYLSQVDSHYYTGCFVFGGILNFKRPVSYVIERLKDLIEMGAFKRILLQQTANLIDDREAVEAELLKQKHEIEQELKERKRQAEQAEESARREAENLRREREKSNNQSGKQSNNSGQSSSSNQNTSSDKRHLNPRIFSDACEVLGMSQGKTKPEYKKAYMKLMSMYHSDKLAGLPEELRKQEEEKAKLVNVAWNTIKKKLK